MAAAGLAGPAAGGGRTRSRGGQGPNGRTRTAPLTPPHARARALSLLPSAKRQGFCVGKRWKAVNGPSAASSYWSDRRRRASAGRVNGHQRAEESLPIPLAAPPQWAPTGPSTPLSAGTARRLKTPTRGRPPPQLERSHSAVPRTSRTQASFNTMRYKGRDSASGIDRKLSIIRQLPLLLLNR